MKNIEERFMEKVSPEPNTGCWLWDGSVAKNGYGKFPATEIYNGERKLRQRVAHRWSYEHFVGPIPDGLEIDHLCCTTSCVNPSHLEAVTRKENMRRSWERGTHSVKKTIGPPKTHCPQGHTYSEQNTYREPNGWRHCRACKKQQAREHYQRKKKADARHVQ